MVDFRKPRAHVALSKLVVFWEEPDLGISEVYVLEMPWEEAKHFYKVHGRWRGGEETTQEEEGILLELEKRLGDPVFGTADNRMGRQKPIPIIGSSTIIVCGKLAAAEGL